MRPGEVRWYRFSTPDKRRPVLILTRNSALEFLGEVAVAPVTSTIREIPSEVRLMQADGMPRDCAVNLDHVQTVTRARVGPLIATVSPGKMSEVRAALLFALGFQVWLLLLGRVPVRECPATDLARSLFLRVIAIALIVITLALTTGPASALANRLQRAVPGMAVVLDAARVLAAGDVTIALGQLAGGAG